MGCVKWIGIWKCGGGVIKIWIECMERVNIELLRGYVQARVYIYRYKYNDKYKLI